MLSLHVETHFCRRCGAAVTDKGGYAYECPQGHTTYANNTPSAGVILLNDANEVLLMKRNIEPFRGTYNIPGGICNFGEAAEAAAVREVAEETRIQRDQYGPLQYVCAAIDAYPYQGEVLPSLAIVFTARLNGAVVPHIDNESQAADFLPLASLDIEAIRFPAIRQALQLVRDGLTPQA
ncbi:MAG TPA: NUDIX domain-containing protein [Candidatus Saccharimonadales bacterium]|nr:NUDIX domain-containing protein [Candidatus Saccharimonadales bacterium]